MLPNLEGRIEIARSSNDKVRIRLYDHQAGVRVVEIELTLEQFALAITNMSTPCLFDFNDSGVVGKVQNIKHETIFVPGSLYDTTNGRPKTRATVKKALKPYEVDGWEGDWDLALNGHYVAKYTQKNDPEGEGRYVKMTFRRHVGRPKSEK
jgi:hypothetical protein